jgi:glycosyltransferase involved in cell wall biosynthesis
MISIITIVKNNVDGLTCTLKSIQKQNYVNWESLIVVGKSTDSTSEAAENFVEIEKRASLISQSSSGIYEAMNLGLENVSAFSKYVVFMNAGDEFNDSSSLSRMVSAIEIQNCGVVIGGYRIKEGKKYPQKEGRMNGFKFTFTPRGGCHQSMIYSLDALRKVGKFNLDYPIAADHALTLEIIRFSGGWRIIDIVSSVEGNGISDKNLETLHIEKQQIRSKHFQDSPWIAWVGYIWKNYYLIRKSLKKLKRKP